MRIISFDIASKSLGLSIVDFNENWKDELKQLLVDFYSDIKDKETEEILHIILLYINKLDSILDNMIVPKIFDAVDLIPNKKLKETTAFLRTNRLNGYLQSIDTYLSNDNIEKCKILLEFQMGPNDKSRNVCSQILYHYSNTDNNFKNNCSLIKPVSNVIKYDTEIVGPSLKNKINLVEGFEHSFFIQKYTKSYDANKKHSICNFKHWINIHNVEHMVKIPKKNMDDVADAHNMILAWLFIKSKLM